MEHRIKAFDHSCRLAIDGDLSPSERRPADALHTRLGGAAVDSEGHLGAGAIPCEPKARIGAALQRRVPSRALHIDPAHGNAVVGGVAEDLRRGVEAHRLTVEKRGREGGWLVPLEPGACVDEVREARRVGFWKSVSRETLDLLEDLPREVAGVAACDHA